MKPTTGTLPDAGVIWTDEHGQKWRCRSRFTFDNFAREGCCMWPYRAKKQGDQQFESEARTSLAHSLPKGVE